MSEKGIRELAKDKFACYQCHGSRQVITIGGIKAECKACRGYGTWGIKLEEIIAFAESIVEQCCKKEEKTMSEYHKIETLYERDEKTFRLKPELILKNATYGMLKSWDFTEKIDGTNIRCIWKPYHIATGEPAKALTFGGKTDNAQIHADLIKWLYENVSAVKLAEIFPDTEAVLYGEGYGAGIQKGGDYSDTKQFILFDVLVGGKWWLSWENVCDVAAKLNIETVPFIGTMTLEAATEMVRNGFQSRLNGGKAKAEGLVGRPAETLFDKKGARLMVKLKTKDF